MLHLDYVLELVLILSLGLRMRGKNALMFVPLLLISMEIQIHSTVSPIVSMVVIIHSLIQQAGSVLMTVPLFSSMKTGVFFSALKAFMLIQLTIVLFPLNAILIHMVIIKQPSVLELAPMEVMLTLFQDIVLQFAHPIHMAIIVSVFRIVTLQLVLLFLLQI